MFGPTTITHSILDIGTRTNDQKQQFHTSTSTTEALLTVGPPNSFDVPRVANVSYINIMNYN
jgi:hypothetical protein